MTTIDLSNLPPFLHSYDDLSEHVRATLDELDNTAKGRAFARFASRVIPLSKLGDTFTMVEMGSEGADGGVDLTSHSIDGQTILYGQSKLTIKKAEEIDTIISKFKDYHDRIHTNKVGQRYMAEFGLPNDAARPTKRAKKPKRELTVVETNDVVPSDCTFVIVTLSKIKSRILPEYEKSSYTSKNYYIELVNSGRLLILDGPDVFPLAQAAYRKSNILPSNISLSFVTEFIKWNDVYIGVISARELKECYRNYGEAIFLDNIRLFVGYSSKTDREGVNSSILETAENYPEEMLARNNGITFRATKVSVVNNRELFLEQGSIVNGCQTTKCIVDASRDDACVLVKIVEVEEAWSIAKTANSQTKVDRIVLDLARYIRPQAVKIAASKAGYIVQDIEDTVYDVFNTIYSDGVVYDELYFLFVGLFSREPKNVISTNYTELRSDLLERLQHTDPAGEQTLVFLFRLFSVAREGKEVAERKYLDKQVYARFWNDNKPDYRSLLTLLAACGCVKMNIYKVYNQFNIIEVFLGELDSILTNDKDRFIRYYCYAYEAIVSYLNSKRAGESAVEKQRYMYDDLRGAPFEALYDNIRMVAGFREDEE